MPRKEYSNTEVTPEARPPIDLSQNVDLGAQRGPTVKADGLIISPELAANLQFNEERVTIELVKTSDSNAWFGPVASQGKPAEVWDDDRRRWIHYNGWLPTGMPITVKRKTVEVITRAKTEKIHHRYVHREGQDPLNQIGSEVIPVQGLTVIRDENPAGHDWLQDLARRYM